MPDQDNERAEVDRFLLDHIETVPHLEALLLLWNSRPKVWTAESIADALYVETDLTRVILDQLVRQNLIASAGNSSGYFYESEAARDHTITLVDRAYRRELIRITRLIHSKPSAAIREFARAFRLRKEHE